jgi:hypothetical protein
MANTDGEVRQQFSLCFTTRLVSGDLLIDSEAPTSPGPIHRTFPR